MGKNFKSNKKHTWMNLATLAHFPLLCAFPQDYLPKKKKISLQHPFAHIYISPQRPKSCWVSLICGTLKFTKYGFAILANTLVST